jgi:hypothetical protein
VFPGRWFAIYPSALIGSFILVSTLSASAEDLHCRVVPPHEPSAAEQAYLAGDASRAESLYREALAKSPHDAALTAGLVRSLLREQKVDDASSAVAADLSLAPNAVSL